MDASPPARRCGVGIGLTVAILLATTAACAGDRGSSQESGPKRDETAPALDVHEALYAVIGHHGGETTARFQLSFRYRLVNADSPAARQLPGLEHLHAGFTQTSLWNLSAESRPFEDTTFRPSLFWEGQWPQPGAHPEHLRVGYEHASNGQADTRSRGIDTLFIWPAWFLPAGARELVITPKAYIYVSKDRMNPAIEDYRGYLDAMLQYGRADGWQIALLGRYGRAGKATLQIDLSHPLREAIASRTGGYLYVQAFSGYGETLQGFDQKKDFRLRFGFAIVR